MLKRSKGGLQEHLNKIEYLEKQDAKKTEFFLAASHQLKSPVAIIQWCLQSITESSRVDSKERELVTKALIQANAMSHLITDMLHVFRLVNRRGKKQQTYSAVNVNLVIEQVLSQYEMVAHRQKVHLVKGPMEILPTVYADEGYVKQAIINLIDNAIKYSGDGKKVTISTKVAKDGFVEICVADEGIGIPETEQSKLFTEFFRGQEAQEITHEGTGLGLVLVKHIVEEFGGEILVKSQLHQGSKFTIRLPYIS